MPGRLLGLGPYGIPESLPSCLAHLPVPNMQYFHVAWEESRKMTRTVGHHCKPHGTISSLMANSQECYLHKPVN